MVDYKNSKLGIKYQAFKHITNLKLKFDNQNPIGYKSSRNIQ